MPSEFLQSLILMIDSPTWISEDEYEDNHKGSLISDICDIYIGYFWYVNTCIYNLTNSSLAVKHLDKIRDKKTSVLQKC